MKYPIAQGITMTIDYDHKQNFHPLEGAAVALPEIFGSNVPASLLDIGCGTGTWLRAALDLGVSNVFGIDGVRVAQEHLHVAKETIGYLDLAKPFNLGRQFDVALCLEVAEHLPEESSDGLISSITNHSDSILFSAACPGQPGQHHVNCHWPTYWQRLFNRYSYACDDSIRWQIWGDERIPPWYRQNIFWARRNPANAGREPRLIAVIHPDMRQDIAGANLVNEIGEGSMPAMWYLTTPARAAVAKLRRLIRSGVFGGEKN
jgi:SAM-dependent methyltransferase